MTYSPGSPGYPPAQPGRVLPGRHTVVRQTMPVKASFRCTSTIAVAAARLAGYLLNFGPTFILERRPRSGRRWTRR